jgi:simple sugar transport system ATP-binding protein
MMVGREVDLVVDKAAAKPGEPVLELKDLVVRDDRGHAAVNGLNLTVRAGEIVAIAGVQGNGQSELVEAITGLRDVDQGEVRINGKVFENDPRAVYSAGVAHIPEDRMEDGLIGDFTVADNMVLTSYWREPFSTGLRLNGDAIVESATELVEQFDVRTPSIFNAVANLSGGNQQKVIAAREFSRTVELIVASQPTRGIDVGSIEYIHGRIVQKRDEGAAVLIVSTELEEVIALGDRIAVMFQGSIVDILEPEEATFERLGLLMGGAHPEETQPEEAAEMAATAVAASGTDD